MKYMKLLLFTLVCMISVVAVSAQTAEVTPTPVTSFTENTTILLLIDANAPVEDVLLVVDLYNTLVLEGYDASTMHMGLFSDFTDINTFHQMPLTVAYSNSQAHLIQGKDVDPIYIQPVRNFMDNKNYYWSNYFSYNLNTADLSQLFGPVVPQPQPNGPTIEFELPIKEGWNLIPVGEGLEIEDADDIEDSLIAAYVWDPSTQEYVDLFEGDNTLEDILDEVGYTSFWIYSTEDGELIIEIDVLEVEEHLEQVVENGGRFDEGWNFYVILPQMIELFEGPLFRAYPDNGISYNNVYAWEFDEWESGNYEDDIVGADDDDIIGLPILIYHQDDFTCSFDQSYDIPAFPEMY